MGTDEAHVDEEALGLISLSEIYLAAFIEHDNFVKGIVSTLRRLIDSDSCCGIGEISGKS